ncbi:MAG: hypothetical protein JO264_02840 [Acidisphaera sp.]|nr:hypothetical protein [Acidisphaera sp.]
MVDLDFAVEDATVERHAASPHLAFGLRVINRTPAIAVRNVMLRCQIRIEPTRRPYRPSEKDRLVELFGTPERWGDTLRGFLWTHTGALVPGFDTACRIELPVPCSYDFNIAATKYFHGIEDGEVPLTLLFSGSVFYGDDDGQLQIDQIAWSKEASYRLPVALWHDMMRHYYPNGHWLCLDRDVFERLHAYKRRSGHPTWERALEALLDSVSAEAAP